MLRNPSQNNKHAVFNKSAVSNNRAVSLIKEQSLLNAEAGADLEGGTFPLPSLIEAKHMPALTI